MTHEEIRIEMKKEHDRIGELIKEVNAEPNVSKCLPKYDEMVECAKRISELDTLNKELLLTELQKKVDEILEKFRRR